MTDIYELNRRRAVARMALEAHNMSNMPIDADKRLASDARGRLLMDAWDRTEADYAKAMNALSTEELIALSQEPS